MSLLAAVALVDEQRWDGQERPRATRTSASRAGTRLRLAERTASYTASIEALFAAYDRVCAEMLEALKRAIRAARGDEGRGVCAHAEGAGLRRGALRAAASNQHLAGADRERAPLENQISRLLASEFAEVRRLGERLKAAAAAPAWNVTHDEARVLLAEAGSWIRRAAAGLSEALLRAVKTAPTLVKYSAPNEYAIATRAEMRQAAAELMAGQAIEDAPVVDLVEDAGSLEVELATSLLYAESRTSWRQIQRTVASVCASRVAEIVSPRGEASRAARRAAARVFRRAELPVRHPDGHRRLPRHAPASTLRAAGPALYRRCTDTRRRCAPAQPTLAEAGLRPDLQPRNGRRARCLPRSCVMRRGRRLRRICCRWGRGCGRCSRWTLPRHSISPSCAAELRATSATGAWPGRCTAPWPGGIRRWQVISGLRM